MIRKIVHIADIHIRTTKYHDLYDRQLRLFISDLRTQLNGISHNDIRIVITGDIFHQKINISNEQIIMAAWFLSELSSIAPVIIIPGNHDFLENNTERIDSITPIVKLLDNPAHIRYYKDSGVYSGNGDENVRWVVYSLYQHNQRTQFTKEDGCYYIGLFHGPIQGLSTDLGYVFDDAYDRLNFTDLDLLLCGDIHKRQVFKLPSGGDAIMIGSLIQQDFAETIKYHGYGIFDMKEKKYTFHDLSNEQPFLHFKINDIGEIETESEHLINLG